MIRRIILVLTTFLLSISLKADTLQRLSAIATGTPCDTKAVGIYAYLANRGGTAIIDISDSTSPVLTYVTSGSPITWSVGLDVVDTMLYVNAFSDLWIGRLYPPDSIHFISRTDLPEYAATVPWGIQVIDTILFFANGTEGLYILNVINPVNPTVITSYNTPGRLTEFFILDSLIYLADLTSMIILNISNPASPQYVGAVDIPGSWGGTDVHVVWPYAYATAGCIWGTDGSIKIIDVSNPASPSVIGSIDNIRGDPIAVFVNDDYIYCAARDWWSPKENKWKIRADVEGGIRVARISLGDSIVASYDTPGNPREVFVRGNLLLVPDSDSLQILHHNKTGVEEQCKKFAANLSLQIIPNPFSTSTKIQFQSSTSENTILKVFDVTGKLVKEFDQKSPIVWGGRDNQNRQLPSGIYLVQLMASNVTATKKAILLE